MCGVKVFSGPVIASWILRSVLVAGVTIYATTESVYWRLRCRKTRLVRIVWDQEPRTVECSVRTSKMQRREEEENMATKNKTGDARVQISLVSLR